jgi:hypothetical protein
MYPAAAGIRGGAFVGAAAHTPNELSTWTSVLPGASDVPPGGLSAGPFPADLGTTLAIGAAEPITITLDRQLPDGPWDALVTLRSGLCCSAAHAPP